MCIINHDGKINNTNFLGSCDRASWTVTFTVHTARVPAPHNHSHHNQCRTPYAAVHTLVLLMMGIMMPETWWDKSLVINIRLVASCWFLSLFTLIILITEYLNTSHWSSKFPSARKRISPKFINNRRPQEVWPPLDYWTLRGSKVLSLLPHFRESTIGKLRTAHYNVTLQGAGSRTWE